MEILLAILIMMMTPNRNVMKSDKPALDGNDIQNESEQCPYYPCLKHGHYTTRKTTTTTK